MYDCQRILSFPINLLHIYKHILQNIFGYTICCVVGTIFARIDCCSQNQDPSEKLKKRVGLIKDIFMFVVVAAVIITTTTTTIVAKTAMETTASESTNINISTVPTTLKTTLTENNWTGTNSPAFSTTTVTITEATSFFSHCPDYLNHLSNVLYSEQIGCILADIDNMTFQSFDEALKRCK